MLKNEIVVKDLRYFMYVITDCSLSQMVSGEDLAIQLLWQLRGTRVQDRRGQDLVELLILDKREASSSSSVHIKFRQGCVCALVFIGLLNVPMQHE